MGEERNQANQKTQNIGNSVISAKKKKKLKIE